MGGRERLTRRMGSGAVQSSAMHSQRMDPVTNGRRVVRGRTFVPAGPAGPGQGFGHAAVARRSAERIRR